jgi:small subunit ribosomal protein S6
MFLLDSGKFAADPDNVSKQVLGLLEKSGGTVVAHRPWQDGRLAYEIAGQRKGLHFLTYFRMDSGKLDEVERSCKLSDTVLRYMVISHPQKLFDAMVAALNPESATEEATPEEKPAEAEKAEATTTDD